MSKEIHLNLEEETLFGWEPELSVEVAEAIVKGIEAEDDFPVVPVIKLGDGNYELSACWSPLGPLLDGGHARAVGHYVAGKPLKCIIVNESKKLPASYERVNIKDIILIDDPKEYLQKRRAYPKYRNIYD
ncbi:MAG: hypothetical protein ABIJ20_00430 [Nanoarchaeota archaeon]|nr:hypothetical protein [Nanoarchaeota archaeon]MBU1445373.1 hypothetical protein [Nanoarchaeota archaeon]MBU2406530.1 hypothetical protein [Nanoarchaeota archaeon]MBU2420146.1 hypothetical protein [Nanoarchaeota archaeon]MBU2475279.1 hypothetical protein [Nanoarchaeota archaeon]